MGMTNPVAYAAPDTLPAGRGRVHCTAFDACPIQHLVPAPYGCLIGEQLCCGPSKTVLLRRNHGQKCHHHHESLYRDKSRLAHTIVACGVPNQHFANPAAAAAHGLWWEKTQ
ncbi:hypothetical protein CMUS01_00209 [Colletotrichum musicola]|uniref:Uncharacterized protein n=1 Tax=Colletotrichum musicola TaxID=2175873 RepID=A0A8H6U937_9PEZI|nr:hypothetical protein CMUS01_00209 [Colletotrichum musicola]